MIDDRDFLARNVTIPPGKPGALKFFAHRRPKVSIHGRPSVRRRSANPVALLGRLLPLPQRIADQAHRADAEKGKGGGFGNSHPGIRSVHDCSNI